MSKMTIDGSLQWPNVIIVVMIKKEKENCYTALAEGE